MSYKSDFHRKYLVKYHIIFVCKYRRKVLKNESISTFLKNLFTEISESEKSKFIIKTMEVDEDHIHFLIESSPSLRVVQIVRKLKQESTFGLWRDFEEYLSKIYWKDRTFWTDGYFVSTTGDVSSETVRRYIENQG